MDRTLTSHGIHYRGRLNHKHPLVTERLPLTNRHTTHRGSVRFQLRKKQGPESGGESQHAEWHMQMLDAKPLYACCRQHTKQPSWRSLFYKTNDVWEKRGTADL